MTNAIRHKSLNGVVRVPELMRVGLKIWLKILAANRGVSFAFVLGCLKRSTYDIFVDASTEWGIGGCFGPYYFQYPWDDLKCFGTDVIARKELLAALVALVSFATHLRNRLVQLHSDNSCVVQWLVKGRSSNPIGTSFLARWELQKYLLNCKITPIWLQGSHNTSADLLSRGSVPTWLEQRGTQSWCDLRKLAFEIQHAELSWSPVLKA